jgi:hypothetical protein
MVGATRGTPKGFRADQTSGSQQPPPPPPNLAEAWLRTIESKFALLTIPCADSSKAHFAAQQLCGAARIWWDNYCAMQADGHVIS